MPRLFLAINLPDDIKTALAAELPRFAYLKFRQIPQENWHVTLKFIGEVEDTKLPLIREAVARATAQFKPIALRLADVGFLNRRIFAFNLERSPKLFALFRLIDDRLAARGVCPGERFRTFSAHITVGRKDPPVRNDTLHSVRHFEIKSKAPLSFTAQSVDLMESTLEREGSHYQTIEKYSFTALRVC